MLIEEILRDENEKVTVLPKPPKVVPKIRLILPRGR